MALGVIWGIHTFGDRKEVRFRSSQCENAVLLDR
jgi:hypothetical protein